MLGFHNCLLTWNFIWWHFKLIFLRSSLSWAITSGAKKYESSCYFINFYRCSNSSSFSRNSRSWRSGIESDLFPFSYLAISFAVFIAAYSFLNPLINSILSRSLSFYCIYSIKLPFKMSSTGLQGVLALAELFIISYSFN